MSSIRKRGEKWQARVHRKENKPIEPLKARAKLAKVGEDDQKLCDTQLKLIEMGYQGPARFKY